MTYIPGDIFLTSGTAPVDRLIQVGESIRHSKKSSKWNHAGIITDDQGGTIEALGHGVQRSNLTAHSDRLVINTGLSHDARLKVVSFAESKLGDEYDYWEDVLMGVDCLTGLHLHDHPGGAWICSELVAAALTAGGLTLSVPVSETLPSDLYVEFKQTI